MQKNSAFNKAWLKVTNKDNTFLPVNVIQRTSKLRSLVCDEGTTDRKLAYEVQHNLLIPRNTDKSESDLLKMQYANLPELKKYFSPHQMTNNNGSSKPQNYKYIGQNLIVDLKLAADNNGDHYESVELEKFYKLHLQELLSNNQKKQQFTIIVSKDNINPHCYLDPLLQLLAKAPQLWPHAAKIQKLSVILKKLLFNVTLQLKLGFLQHKENAKQSRKVMFVHLKPFIPNWLSQSLVIPDQIIALGNSKKFSQMYNAPTLCPPETPESETLGLVDAFMSLGVQVKAIHSLMRCLSLIINLDRTQVQKQTQGSDQRYVKYHIKTTNSKRAQESLENISKILEMGKQRLEQLMIFGEAQNAQSSDLEKKKIALFDNLGTKKQVANYRIHTIKVILYEIWIAHICETLNKALCSEQNFNNSVIENTQFQTKCFVVLSYGVAKKCNSYSLNQRSTQLNNVIFWNNARYVMESKLLDVAKSCITASIIGKDSQGPKKVVGILQQKNGDKCQQKLNRFKTMFNYQNSIQKVRNNLLDPTKNTLQFKEIDLLQKEELLYLLYEEILSYTIFSQIQKQIFGIILKRETVKQNPQSLYEYVWNSYEQNLNLRKFDKDIKCITNSQLLSQNQQTLKQISEAIHIKQLRLQEEGNKQIRQLKLLQMQRQQIEMKRVMEIEMERIMKRKMKREKREKEMEMEMEMEFEMEMKRRQEMERETDREMGITTPNNMIHLTAPFQQQPSILITRNLIDKKKYKKCVAMKRIILKVGPSQIIEIDADEQQKTTFKAIIFQHLEKSRASFCLMVPGKDLQYITPDKTIKDLFDRIGSVNEIKCIIIKPYDKFLYLDKMEEKELSYEGLDLTPVRKKTIQKRANQKALKYGQKLRMRRNFMHIYQIMKCIAMYTQNCIFGPFNEEFRKLKICEIGNFSSHKFYNLASVMTNTLRELPYFVGTVHRGINSILLTDNIKEGDIIIWSAFSSTSKSQWTAKSFVSQQSDISEQKQNTVGSVCIIDSYTGRDISLYSANAHQQQVLFLPYSYFIVTKIQRIREENRKIDQVWLQQMPSPEYFDRDIVLYLNEEPFQANQFVMKLQEDLGQRVHALQLISIQMLDNWLCEFLAFLQFKNKQIKIIVDVSNKSSSAQVQQKFNDVVKVLIKHKADTKLGLLTSLSQEQGKKLKLQEMEEDILASDQYEVINKKQYQKIVEFCKFRNQSIFQKASKFIQVSF